MQLTEGPAAHFGWSESKMNAGKVLGSSNNSYGADDFRKQTTDLRASFNISQFSKCQSIVLFTSTPWMGLKTLLSLQCCAKSSKLAFLDHSVTIATEPAVKETKTIALKDPSNRPTVPIKRVPRLKSGKTSKSNLASRVSRQEAGLKVSSSEIRNARSRLEQLGVAEPALFKYVEQGAAADISVDNIVKAISVLMGISRVSWNQAISMLSKSPALLKAEPSKIKATVTFLTELGLDQEDVAEVLASHPALLEFNVEEMRSLADYLMSVGVQKEEFPEILMNRPQVFSNNVDDVKYAIECLLGADVPSKDLSRLLMKVPELFSPTTRKNLKSRIIFFKQVGLDGGALSRGIARRPNILNFDLESMRQTHDYLMEFLAPSDVSKLVRRFAEVLVLDPTRKMDPIVNHLLRLGVKRSNLGKVLLRRPQLLGYTVPGFEPTLQFLKELGIRDNLLGKVISISPQVLTLNCEEKLKPVVDYLRSVGLEDGDMERLLVRNAQLLCCSIEKNIDPKVHFFLNMGLEKKDVIKIMVLFPSMFGQSIEGSLEPKYNYLVNVMKRSPEEIVDFPQYFGYSLEKRIKPRFEQLRAKGIHNVTLPSMLACVEADFISRYLVGTPPSRAPYNSRKTPRKSKYSDV